MEAFVGGSGVTVTGGRQANVCSRSAGQRRVATIVMVKDFDMWKTWLAGGFPGGEGFFKKWLEGGMEDYVPGLEDEMQVGKSGVNSPAPAARTAAAAPAAYQPSDDEPELVMETDENGRMRLVIKEDE